MNENNTVNNTILQLPNQYLHHSQHELSLSIPIVTTEQHEIQQQQQQQQPIETTKKQKCRGNRKRQRYRRQLYAHGKTSEEVENLVQEKFPSQIQQQQQQQQQQGQQQEHDSEMTIEENNIQNIDVCIPLNRVTFPKSNSSISLDSIEMVPKRKRFILTPTPTLETTTILDQPFSQLSISQKNPKKMKRTTTTNVQSNNEMNELSMNSTQKNYKSCYLKVPDRIFKQLLLNAIDNRRNKISQGLNTKEKLDFIRQIAEITNNFYFKDLQRQLWEEYYDLSLKDENWESATITITKGYAHQHNICRMYKPKKSYIEQRRTTIEHQLQQIGNQLHENLLKLQENIQQWEPSIDFDVLSHAINECVKSGQQRLKDEFNYKKKMLILNWNDYQLLIKFYQLKPNAQQIELAKKIWQATTDELKTKEQLEILRQRIFLKRLPTKTNRMINELLDDNEKTLSNPFLDQKQRNSFASRCSKTIIQCKFNLMMVQIDEFETIIRRHHLTLIDLQNKLSQLNKENPSIYTMSLLNCIEERRQAMITRLIEIREHKLKTFFDEAPTMVLDNN